MNSDAQHSQPNAYRLRRPGQRGMALIMALLVTSLLTITVVEFFFSAEVDSRMARNSVHSLQASLLARSGIALGEALLIKDEDSNIDSFMEEWCPAPAREGRACQIEDGGGLVVIPEGMRLRVEIWDESGKININNIKPVNVGVATAIRRDRDSENPRRQQIPQMWADALSNLFEARGVNPEAALAIEDYWMDVAEQYFPPASQGGTPGRTPTAGTPGQAGGATADSGDPALASLTPWGNLLFTSLEDSTRIPSGLTTPDLRRLRPFVTALASGWTQRVNINTASREVLTAISNDPEWVDEIITRRQSEPLPASALSGMRQGSAEDRGPRTPSSLIAVKSSLFLIRASAIVNVNPLTGRGGISRSAEMLVQRGQAPPRPGVQRTSADGTLPTWKLTRLYWQKEGGAVLFRPEVESGTGEVTDSQF